MRMKGISTARLLGSLASLAMAAFLGAFAKAYLERPKPSIQMVSAQLDSSSVSAQDAAQAADVLPALAQMTQSHSWLETIPVDITFEKYIAALSDNRSKGRLLIQRMQRLKSAMEGWPTGGDASEAARAAFDIAWDNSVLILPHLWGEVKRQGRALLSAPPELAERPPIIALRKDSDGDFTVVDGIRRLPVYWSRQVEYGVLRDELRDTAEGFARGIAHGDGDLLADIRSLIDDLLAEETTTAEIIDLAARELGRYSTVVVQAILTNSGSATVSIAPEARLYLNTRGLSVTDREGRGSTVDRDCYFPLVRVVEVDASRSFDGRFDPDGKLAAVLGGLRRYEATHDPIVIPGGTSMAVTFRSLAPVHELANRDAVTEVVLNGERHARIAVIPFTAHVANLRSVEPLLSSAMRFDGAGRDSVFARQVEWPKPAPRPEGGELAQGG